MPAIQVPDAVKRLIDRHVADGSAASESDFVEAAVRRYADDLADDDDEIVAAAKEGIEAIERGDYVTISVPDDLGALRERMWASAMILAEQMRAAESDSGVDPQVKSHVDV
jgi:Arc/MetJ-type ribon-helix-helix transcriptional regulator